MTFPQKIIIRNPQVLIESEEQERNFKKLLTIMCGCEITDINMVVTDTERLKGKFNNGLFPK